MCCKSIATGENLGTISSGQFIKHKICVVSGFTKEKINLEHKKFGVVENNQNSKLKESHYTVRK
jgi:hypothetical protein